jgi:hypothetical protein
MGTLGLDHQRAADQAERRRILRYRWLIWVSIIVLQFYVSVVILGIVHLPVHFPGLTVRFVLVGLYLLAGIGIWRSQQLDKRLKS